MDRITIEVENVEISIRSLNWDFSIVAVSSGSGLECGWADEEEVDEEMEPSE